MCKACVADGRMTIEEMDELIMAGDTSVIDIRDRLAAGVDPMIILIELGLGCDEPTARALLAMIR